MSLNESKKDTIDAESNLEVTCEEKNLEVTCEEKNLEFLWDGISLVWDVGIAVIEAASSFEGE